MSGKVIGTRSVDRPGAVLSTCIDCGRYTARGESYCPRHVPSRRRGSGAARARFRREVLARAGGRCECVENGERCKVEDPRLLEAHHVRPVVDGGDNDPRFARCVCHEHHRRITAAQGRAA